MQNSFRNRTTITIIAGSLILVLLMITGTIWMGHSAQKGTEQAAGPVLRVANLDDGKDAMSFQCAHGVPSVQAFSIVPFAEGFRNHKKAPGLQMEPRRGRKD